MTSNNSSNSDLPVAVDAMGGDFGSEVVVEGALAALRELNLKSVLVGDEEILGKHLKKFKAESELEIIHAPGVVKMEDSPSKAIRRKLDSSILRAFEIVRDGKASSVVSAGNTGAVMATGLYVSGSLPGIDRPAIATLIPNVGEAKPTVLLDSGANIDCHSHQLVQFALMGNFYAKLVISAETPRIALLSNGTESSKGTDIIKAAAISLADLEVMNFIGFVEGRDIPRDKADVIVCDGFLGNVVLKTMEGSVELVIDSLKYVVEKSTRGKFGMWLAKPIFKSLFKDKLDPSAYGGAPLLGLNDIAIVCHGSSNGRAIKNGVRVADKLYKGDLVDHLEQALSILDVTRDGGYENGLWDRVGRRFDKKLKSKDKTTASKKEDVKKEDLVKDEG